jgi:hypothetical protein
MSDTAAITTCESRMLIDGKLVDGEAGTASASTPK